VGSKGVMVTVVQRDWCLQVVQFVARGVFITIDLSVPVLPIVILAEPPCVKIHQGNVLQFIYYNKLIKLSLSVSDDDDDDLLRYT
jgi:hypothetical protein